MRGFVCLCVCYVCFVSFFFFLLLFVCTFFNNCTGFNYRRWELLCSSTKRRQKKVNQKKKKGNHQRGKLTAAEARLECEGTSPHVSKPNAAARSPRANAHNTRGDATVATALTGTSAPEYTSCSVVCSLTFSSSSPLLAMIFPASNSGIALFHPSATPHSYRLCVKPPSLWEKKKSTPLRHAVQQHTLLFFFSRDRVEAALVTAQDE